YDAPVKHGAPSGAGLQLATKEYQVCLKCHSNFGYENAQIGSGVGQVSNTAMELLPDNGDPANLPNHNSWHPVAGATGRTTRLASNNFLSPFDVGVGTQTMYCSDCHTSTNDPSAGAVGPHGSTHSTGLVKNWDVNTGTGSTNDLCFECHEYDQYANGTPATTKDSDFSCNVGSGCGGVAFTNLHVTHASKPDMDINAAGTQNYTCSLCHVRVSHGWKNKGMLVDKITEAANTRYYFNTAQLAIDTMRASGQWEKNDCATSGCH
ncbi:MAG: hypothetical protein OEX19_15040, partial [Gammaproteobacteria bacterium]|nr:hypothetical protein [Gammaproteobacteria bacterium]